MNAASVENVESAASVEIVVSVEIAAIAMIIGEIATGTGTGTGNEIETETAADVNEGGRDPPIEARDAVKKRPMRIHRAETIGTENGRIGTLAGIDAALIASGTVSEALAGRGAAEGRRRIGLLDGTEVMLSTIDAVAGGTVMNYLVATGAGVHPLPLSLVNPPPT